MPAIALRLVETPAGPLPETVAAPLARNPTPVKASPPPPPRSRLREAIDGIAARVLPTLLMLLVLLAAWQIGCGGPGSRFPSPTQVWSESREVILHPLKGVEIKNGALTLAEGADVGILVHIGTSLRRVLIGYSLAAVAGIALGVLIGQSLTAYRALDPIFQVLRTVPPLAWLPISLAAFQQAQPATLFLIFITAIWPVILNTAAGVQAIPQTYRNVGKVLQLSPATFFFKIMLPATVPHMFTGLRIGVGMSWLAIVAAEMVQGGTGIGFFIWDSYNSSLISDTIVALVAIGLVGFTLDRLIAALGRRVARQA